MAQGVFAKFFIVVALTISLGGCFPLNTLNPVPPVQFKMLLSRAEAGDGDAQLEASEMLSCSRGRCAFGPWRPKCDDAESARWLRLAAENGNTEAQAKLAAIAEQEEGKHGSAR